MAIENIVVCPHCGTRNRVQQEGTYSDAKCGKCHQPLAIAASSTVSIDQQQSVSDKEERKTPTGSSPGPENGSPGMIEGMFSGKCSTAAALERMRMRLLDLSTNNRLLNYRFPKGKVLRVIDTPPDPLFERLFVDGKAVSVLPIPDPPLELYEEVNGALRKPDVREYAEYLGIDPSYEITSGPRHQERTDTQSLQYPENLEAILRKLDQAARTAVEESGTNMLYITFGYLEWYEGPNSEKPLLAPLLILPISLTRSGVDPQTGYFRYSLEYRGDDLTENITLREKMRQAFSLELPPLEEGSTPEEYFAGITEFSQFKPRWKVRRQITLCLLSFGKLLLYLDLDARRWPSTSPLDRHPIVSTLFGGAQSASLGGFAEDYDIDRHPEVDGIPLVYDADSSQHSALIDAMKGKNLVIEGPPGTGKSQTITNLIAAALAKGKTVLFVAEKLAALQVVKRRLDRAQLGDFCLELHSHKTQKRQLLDGIKARLDGTFLEPLHLARKSADLESTKRKLNRYVLLINSVVGNQLGLTIHEVIWASDRYRTELGEKAALLGSAELSFAPSVGPERFAKLEEAIDQLRRHLLAVGHYGPSNAWWGYFPDHLLFGDDAVVGLLLRQLSEVADDLSSYIAATSKGLSVSLPCKAEESKNLCELMLDRFPAMTGEEAFDLLPKTLVEDSLEELRQFEQTVLFVHANQSRIQASLRDPSTIDDDTLTTGEWLLNCGRRVNQAVTRRSIISQRANSLREIVPGLDAGLDFFLSAAEACGLNTKATLQSLALIEAIIRVAALAPLDILHLRAPHWNEPGVLKLTRDGCSQSSILRAKRSELQRHFALNLLPSKEDMAFAIRTFKANDGPLRFFRRGHWRARKIYRGTRSIGLKMPQPQQCAREFGELLSFVESRERFEANREFQRIAGGIFDGIDTDFSKLERIAEWYCQVHNELRPKIAPDEAAVLDKILQLGPHVFEWLKARASAAISAWADLQQVQSRLESLFQEDILPGLNLGPGCPLDALIKKLSQAVAQLDALARYLGAICVTDESPASAASLLDMLVSVRRALRELEENQKLRDWLGPRYKGIATDFAPIFSAHAWGLTVKGLQLPQAIEEWLLTPNARERTTALATFAKATRGKWERIDEIRTQLGRFGTLDWRDWHRSADVTPDVVCCRANEAFKALEFLIVWADLSRAIQNATSLGLNTLSSAALNGAITADELPIAFRYCIYSSIAKSLFRANRELMQFSGLSHEQLREQFIELDKQILLLTGQQCAVTIAKRRVPSGVGWGPVKDYTELVLLHHEINKRRRHIPIRQLVKRAGHALVSIKPCFMMGPLSVAQYLEPGVVTFDLIIMDEASQLKPEDAIGAVARGGQLVVVGDPKQLPPTSFFDTLPDEQLEDDDMSTALDDVESILDVCQLRFHPVRRLRWHYRSQHDSLIAFSNKEFYQDRPLFLFPSPYQSHKRLGICHHFVEDARYENRCNPKEAARVADAVIEHIRKYPEESLGAVTLNITQCDLIQEEVDKRLKEFPEVQEYLENWQQRGEPLFVKNLENVQGDERDTIFISTTFGKSAEGVVYNRFGPITRQNGWRRLNVLFTRAKRRVELFTSMEPEDIRIDPGTSSGVQALRNYLMYARTGILDSPRLSAREPDSDFEIAVGQAIREGGYEIVPQLGIAGFFMDIAVRNPDRDGEYLVAVECDGATYHSSRSARDRDRLRQEVLEGKGWAGKIYRIWSADWFKDPRTQGRRLLDFLAQARETAKRSQENSHKSAVAASDFVHDASRAQKPIAVPVQATAEEMIVEVWDYVTYCYLDDPERRKSVQIVKGNTDVEKGVVGDMTPLAKALRGAAVGNQVEMNVPGKPPRQLKVLSIER